MRKQETRQFARELGFKLRVMREFMSLSKSDASKKFDISPSMVSKYESGQNVPNLMYLSAIVKATGMKLDDLLIDGQAFVKKLYKIQ